MNPELNWSEQTTRELCAQISLGLHDLMEKYQDQLELQLARPARETKGEYDVATDKKATLRTIKKELSKTTVFKFSNRKKMGSSCGKLIIDQRYSGDAFYDLMMCYPNPQQKILQFWDLLLSYTAEREKVSENYRISKKILENTFKELMSNEQSDQG